jgi:uncharacterized coiled-coil DUF342 family protein
MEDYSKYTPIELLKIGNDIKTKHDALKQEIVDYSFQIEELEKLINEKLVLLDELEKNYVVIIEKITI